MSGRIRWLWFLGVPVSTLAAAANISSLSYSTTFTDPSGTQKSISFTGTPNGTALTGTLIVDGIPEQVTATIGPDGSVSGRLTTPDGKQLGVFWGRPNGARSMQGSFDLNGQVGDWSVPLRVPAPTATSQ